MQPMLGPEHLARDFVQAHARKVGEIMTQNIVSVTPQSTLAEVVGLMEKHHVKRLPVIDGGRLVGIVSRANLVRALLAALEQPAPAAGSDDDIRRHILDRIAAEPWGPRFAVSVTVADGVVDFSGTCTYDHERTALKVVSGMGRPGLTAAAGNPKLLGRARSGPRRAGGDHYGRLDSGGSRQHRCASQLPRADDGEAGRL